MSNNKKIIKISEETKKILEQARKPEFSESELQAGKNFIESKGGKKINGR